MIGLVDGSMNFAKRATIKARHMVKHKTMGGGSSHPPNEEEDNSAIEAFTAYETRVKTLHAMTMDARAQLAEAFLQLGHSTQCFEELTDPDVDVSGAAAAMGGSPVAPMNNAFAVRSKAVAAELQRAFHASFGETLQGTLLAPLESEMELCEKTRDAIARKHSATLESQHYESKLSALREKGASEKEKDKEKLQRNTDKAQEAAQALTEAKEALDADLRAHDSARLELLTDRVNGLKGMLHRFCEAALTALSSTSLEEGKDLDRYNIYGDVNHESALSKMRRGLTSSTKSAGAKADSVGMRLGHMKRHAATTFTTAKKENEASTDDPVELETNEMAGRYHKAWSVLEKLPPILELVKKWYKSGLSTFINVAGELELLVKETDPEAARGAVHTFRATLDEISASLDEKFIVPMDAQVLGPLNESLVEYKDFPEKLRDRRVKALEREHYNNKVASLEKKTHNEKASEAAKEKANERWERNKTKASSAEEAAKNETLACRDRLLAFDQMFKTRIQSTAASLDDLQRNFYLDFATKVASKLQIDAATASPADADSANKLNDLMARGIIVPQSGMTHSVAAASQYQRHHSNEQPLPTSGTIDRQQSLSAAVQGQQQQASVPAATSYARPPPVPTTAPPAVPQQQQQSSGPTDIHQLAGRKTSLTPDETEQVRQLMMKQASISSEVQQPGAAPVVVSSQPVVVSSTPVQGGEPSLPVAVAVGGQPTASPQQQESAPPPPPPPPSIASSPAPGTIQVKALYDFEAVQDGDLGFKAGDVIFTEEAAFNSAGASGGWINGHLAADPSKSGVFPSNYVAI